MRQLSVRARRVAAVSVSLVLAAGAAACGPKDNDGKGAGSGDSEPQKGGTLTVLNSNPQDDFDPARLYTSGADWPSGGHFLAPIFDGRQIVQDGANFNTGFLNDESVNAEIDAINKLTDLDAAAKRWGALDSKIGEQALTVPLFRPVCKRLYGKDVKNIVISDWTGVLSAARHA